MRKKIGVIVQARMGSTRLPGKVAKELAGKPMLTHVIERLKESEELDQIIVATSVKDEDERVIKIAEKENVSTYRGSEADVLSRYIEAAEKYQIDTIVRVTADCPLIDPITVDELIVEFLKSSNLDYMTLQGYPLGLDTGICTLESLKKVERKVKNDPQESRYREHVTLYISHYPEEFNIDIKEAPKELKKDYRLSVDEVEDFELMENIYNRLYEEGRIIDIKEVLKLLDNEPELAKINSDIKQKKY